MSRDFFNELKYNFTDSFIMKTFKDYIVQSDYIISISNERKIIKIENDFEIIQKIFFREKYPEVYNAVFEVIIAFGGVIKNEYGILKPKDFFVFLKYNKNLELFSVKFDYYIK